MWGIGARSVGPWRPKFFALSSDRLRYNTGVRFFPSASRRVRRRQRGSTTVEFAMVFPLLAFILFGAIDGGRLVIDRFMVSYAAVLGARMASVRSTSSVTAVQTSVVASVSFLNLSASNITVAVNGVGPQTDASFASHPTGSPNTVTVNVTYNYRAVWIPLYNHAVKTLTGSSQVGLE